MPQRRRIVLIAASIATVLGFGPSNSLDVDGDGAYTVKELIDGFKAAAVDHEGDLTRAEWMTWCDNLLHTHMTKNAEDKLGQDDAAADWGISGDKFEELQCTIVWAAMSEAQVVHEAPDVNILHFACALMHCPAKAMAEVKVKFMALVKVEDEACPEWDVEASQMAVAKVMGIDASVGHKGPEYSRRLKALTSQLKAWLQQ